MTEQPENVVDWIADLESNPAYQMEEAAAELALEMSEILRHAFRARPDIDQKTLARLIGVSEGRVSQILHSDGNLHVSTLAKYLRALGYSLQVKPRSIAEEAPPLRRNTRRGVTAHLYKTTFASTNGVSEVYTTFVGSDAEPKEALDRPRLMSSRSLSSAKRAYVDDSIQAATKPASSKSPRIEAMAKR